MSRLGDRLNAKITEWYDRQSFETIFLVGVAPLILVALVPLIATLLFSD